MMLGLAPTQGDLLRSTVNYCHGRVPEDSIYAVLHRECFNLYTSARTMGPEAAAYQLGHSKVSMTQEHYSEEYQEALDTRAVMDAFSPKQEPSPTDPDDEK